MNEECPECGSDLFGVEREGNCGDCGHIAEPPAPDFDKKAKAFFKRRNQSPEALAKLLRQMFEQGSDWQRDLQGRYGVCVE